MKASWQHTLTSELFGFGSSITHVGGYGGTGTQYSTDGGGNPNRDTLTNYKPKPAGSNLWNRHPWKQDNNHIFLENKNIPIQKIHTIKYSSLAYWQLLSLSVSHTASGLLLPPLSAAVNKVGRHTIGQYSYPTFSTAETGGSTHTQTWQAGRHPRLAFLLWP